MVLVLAPFAQLIPRASLAGLLMLAAFRMVDREQLAFHLRATRFDAGVVVVTALAAVVISVEFCIVIGVFLSFVLYVPRAAHVRLTQLIRTPNNGVRERLPGEPADDRLLIYHLEGELFFGAEPDLKEHCVAIENAARRDVGAVILVLERARNPDAAFLSLLQTLDRSLRRRNVALILCGVEPGLDKAFACTGVRIQTGGYQVLCEPPRPERTDGDAVHSACYLLGNAFCSTCPRR
jgi:SulP family sulfate permease